MLPKYLDKFLSLLFLKKNFHTFLDILDNKQKNIEPDLDIREKITDIRKIKNFAWSYDTQSLNKQHQYIKNFFPSLTCFNEKGWKNSDYFLLHGPINPFVPHEGHMKFLSRHDRIFFMEDGFFHSLKPFSDPHASPDERSSLSYLFDDTAFYFDGTRKNRLEEILNSCSPVTGTQLERANNLIKLISRNKLTKYNNQPILKADYGNKKNKKVLIIDQSFNDSSIIYGNADAYTFKRLLACAIDENTDKDILIKTHPDSKFKKKTYFSEVVETDRIKIITDSINPWCLFDIVDKVYVCSSQTGFEALMAGKEVVVFGRPFYAGWGLTDDRNPIKRRIIKRSLEELVYYALIWYTHYVDPSTGNVCEIENTLNYLLNQRNDYFRINDSNNLL